MSPEPADAAALVDRRRASWVLAAAVAAPLLVAAIVLLRRPWAPVLDMAMTELRVRDVGGRHTPLIGLPGRIGTFPDQGSHPGPWSFYLIAPIYRLTGSTAWGLEFASVVINTVAVAGVVAVGKRMYGGTGAIVVAAIVAVAVRGYGPNVLTHPWNPYFPVLIWLLVLVTAWAVLLGHDRLAVVVVIGGSIAAQTHVSYLVSCAAVVALVLAVVGRRWWRSGARRERARPLVVALAAGGFLWLPPVVDQLLHRPGNIRRLFTHFATDQPEPSIGSGTALRVFLRHLDAPSLVVDLVRHDDAFVVRSGLTDAGWVGGLVVLVAWLVSVGVAFRRRHRPLLALHAVLAVALAAGLFSITRIFGKVWFYLTLWAWGTTLLVVVAIAWTALVVVGGHRGGVDRRRPVAVTGAALVVVATALSTGGAVRHQVPERQISDGLRAVVPATADALTDDAGAAVGKEGRYLVFWQDAAYNGAQGYGLLNELERRGFDVGVHRTWRVPATGHRVMAPGTYDAEIHLVSGVFIAEWRRRPAYTEVVVVDTRTTAERERFAALRVRVAGRLEQIGRGDLVEMVDRNLFGASLVPGLPRDVVDDLSEMLLLGVPVAVFIAPPGSSS